MQNNEWLKKLKAGDEVVVCGRYHYTRQLVEKITPKGFIKVNGVLYNPDSGNARGGDVYWAQSLLDINAPRTQEHLIEQHKKGFVARTRKEVAEFCNQMTYGQAVKLKDFIASIKDEK